MPTIPPYVPFFPVVGGGRVGSADQLAAQPTIMVTPSASEVVFVIIDHAWSLYTLTSGAPSGTHVLPLDYDATLNKKYWALTSTGIILDGTLIDNSGNTITDNFGNPITAN